MVYIGCLLLALFSFMQVPKARGNVYFAGISPKPSENQTQSYAIATNCMSLLETARAHEFLPFAPSVP